MKMTRNRSGTARAHPKGAQRQSAALHVLGNIFPSRHIIARHKISSSNLGLDNHVGSSLSKYVMPDLIRHPVFSVDSTPVFMVRGFDKLTMTNHERGRQVNVPLILAMTLLLVFLCTHANAETAQPYANAEIVAKIIPAMNNTFGYDILVSGRPVIHQPSIPGLPGNEGFRTEKDARKVAELVIKKIRNNEMPPTVSIEELNSLGVLSGRKVK